MSFIYLPLDSETGGLSSKTSDILTLYIAAMTEDFKIIDELDLKLKPDDRLPIAEAGALKVNGIDLKAHLADPNTITYSEAKVKIIAFLKKHLKKNGRYSNLIPMGHNLPFDLNYIWQHLISEEEWLKICHYRTIDTNPIVGFLKECGWFPKELGNLGSVVEYLGVPKRAAHNAKEDTLMMVDVYKAVVAMMKAQRGAASTGGGQQQDLISLLEAE